MGIFPNFRGEHKTYLKPPPRQWFASFAQRVTSENSVEVPIVEICKPVPGSSEKNGDISPHGFLWGEIFHPKIKWDDFFTLLKITGFLGGQENPDFWELIHF